MARCTEHRSATSRTPTASSSLTLDDPSRGVNTMNAALPGRAGEASTPSTAGRRRTAITRRGPHVGQEDLLRRRRPATTVVGHGPDRRAAGRSADVERVKAQLPPAGDAGPARGRGDQRLGARRRPGDRAGLPPPHRARRPAARVRPARGHARPAARRRRRRRARCACSASPTALLKVLLEGQRLAPAEALELGLVARAGRHAGGAARRGPGLDRRPTRARGSPGTQRATRSPAARRPARSSPRTCRRSRRTCASSSRAPHAGAAQHPGRGRRGRAGRLRHRVARSRPATSPSWPPARSRRT